MTHTPGDIVTARDGSKWRVIAFFGLATLVALVMDGGESW